MINNALAHCMRAASLDRGLRPTRAVATAGDRLGAIAALLALAVAAGPHIAPKPLMMETGEASATKRTGGGQDLATAESKQWRVGGYLGTSDTIDSIVRIQRPGAEASRIDMTVDGFAWLGQPFKSPIYYGARVQRVPEQMGLGGMVDFIHAKAIADAKATATFTGTRNGQPVPPKARIGDVFSHLEFSHGHNILTLNGLFRMPQLFAGLRPYIGLGGGVSLPHTEVGFKGERERTYEYQYAGLAGQILVGVELPIGRTATFIEWKFTFAPYSVPLSHEPRGHLLFTDLWRQFQAWRSGTPPPGGVLSTTLATNHLVGGVMVRVGGGK
jgi:hypothetical protein